MLTIRTAMALLVLTAGPAMASKPPIPAWAPSFISLADLECMDEYSLSSTSQSTHKDQVLRDSIEFCISPNRSQPVLIEVLRLRIKGGNSNPHSLPQALTIVKQRYAVTYTILEFLCRPQSVAACVRTRSVLEPRDALLSR